MRLGHRSRRLLALSIVGALLAGGSVALGTSLGGRTASPPNAIYRTVLPVPPSTLKVTASIMSARLASLGGGSAAVRGHEIDVWLGGDKRGTELSAIGATGAFYFRPVVCGATNYTGPVSSSGNNKGAPTLAYKVPPTCSSTYNYLTAGTYESTSGNYTPAPEDPQYADYPTTPASLDDSNQVARENVIVDSVDGFAPRYVLGPAVVDNQIVSSTIIKSAYAQRNTTTDQWIVVFNFTNRGSAAFNDVAAKYYGQLVADDLDGIVVSAPIIESTSFPGSGQISGNFTKTSARNLAVLLSSGPLPAPVQRVR